MKEIGSEFWLNHNSEEIYDFELPPWLSFGADNKLLLSGRTAIDYVLRDILDRRRINSVYFPSYCCHSMFQPFIDHGIDIIFYDVDFEGELRFNINTTQECDIFFAMNYFGFSKGRMDSYIEEFKRRDIIVIEDSTHSLLSTKTYNAQTDYLIASLRKWFPVISGGLAVKFGGKFKINHKDTTLEEMVRIREIAMSQKREYLYGDSSIEKESFLKKYSDANEMLNKDYALYRIDRESYKILQNLNIESIIKRRKENAEILYNNLKQKYHILFDELESGDCPIFVPIIFSSYLERDSLRSYLINKNVYCPIHWPKPDILSERNITNIYYKELSLIADQRYDSADMQYLVRRLDEFYE